MFEYLAKLIDTNRPLAFAIIMLSGSTSLLGAIYYQTGTIQALPLKSMLVYFIMGASLPLLLFFMAQSKLREMQAHGTARWATKAEKLHHAAKAVGVYIGGVGLKYKPKFAGKYLFSSDFAPVALIAPPRSGKGVSVIVPTLLSSWDGSVIVTDFKAELYALTAGARERYSGHSLDGWENARGGRIMALCPTAPVGDIKTGEGVFTCGYNPLQNIALGTPLEVSMVQDIGNIIVNSAEFGAESSSASFFKAAAIELFVCTTLHMMYRNRAALDEAKITRQDIKDGRIRLKGADNRPLRNDNDYHPIPDLAEVLSVISQTCAEDYEEWGTTDHREAFKDKDNCYWGEYPTHPTIMDTAAKFAAMDGKTYSNVAATLSGKLAAWRDPMVRQATAACYDHDGNDWYVEDIRNGSKPMSLYLTISMESLDRLRPLIQILFTQITNRFSRNVNEKHDYELLLAIDEAPLLGRMSILERAMAFLPGFGIKTLVVAQGINQILSAYSDKQSVLETCKNIIVFPPNDNAMAKWASEAAGVTTHRYKKTQHSGSGGIFKPVNTTSSKQINQRPLITSDEVRQLRGLNPEKGIAPEALVFVQNEYPMRVDMPVYFLDEALNELSKIPPPIPEIAGLTPADDNSEVDDVQDAQSEIEETNKAADKKEATPKGEFCLVAARQATGRLTLTSAERDNDMDIDYGELDYE